MKDLFIKLGVVALVFSIIGNASADVKVKGETVVYKAQDVTLKGYLAYDETIKGKRPGVLVVHDWWGLNDYAEDEHGCWQNWDTRLSLWICMEMENRRCILTMR